MLTPLQQTADTDTESCPGSCSQSSNHSSVLVDMGKVVGVLRSYPPADLLDLDTDIDELDIDPVPGCEFGSDLSDTDNFLSESPPSNATARVCASCAQQESEIETDSLLGDPLGKHPVNENKPSSTYNTSLWSMSMGHTASEQDIMM